jgi:hypothetical protein
VSQCRCIARAEAYSQTGGFGTPFRAANTWYVAPYVASLAGRNRRAQPNIGAATNYLPLVMNYITATAINRSAPTANLRSPVTERAMMNETENRELPIAAITAWVMLFFGSVSLSVSYFAVHTGLLAG